MTVSGRFLRKAPRIPLEIPPDWARYHSARDLTDMEKSPYITIGQKSTPAIYHREQIIYEPTQPIDFKETFLTPHSHSIVAGGFPEMSYTTRLIPRTSLMIRFDT
jgi:hypothetical protein